MYKGSWLVSGLFVVALGACGYAASPPPTESGGIRVEAQNLTYEDVHSVVITITPSVGSPFDVVLTPPASGDPWSKTVEDIPVGTYTATALAFGAGGVDVLFRSDPTAPFPVTRGGTTTVHPILLTDRAA